MDVKTLQKALKSTIKDLQPDHQAKVAKIANNRAVSQSNKRNLFEGIGKTLKQVAPVAASFIPGMGPLASQLLSTLNDDEWFEAYKSAGASFNELLVTDVTFTSSKPGSTTINKIKIDPRAALMRFSTDVNLGTKGMTDVYGSSLLAQIRTVTNNVLIDDVEAYFYTFDSASKLLAIYYTLEKYAMLATKQPLNIPLLTTAIPVIAPERLNTFMGILAGLKQYIQSSIRLPYALTEAIRWRFGTMFHSFNTGQPGLVTYDIVNTIITDGMDGDGLLETIANDIRELQSQITRGGRASADIYMTFKNHIQRLDVEKAHYDEKEFNLRHNLVNQEGIQLGDEVELIKDSRLATSPAIQASTLSTGDYTIGLPIFPVGEVDIAGRAFYNEVLYYNRHNGTNTQSISSSVARAYKMFLTPGWNSAKIFYRSAMQGYKEGATEDDVILSSSNTANEFAMTKEAAAVTALTVSLGLYKKDTETSYSITNVNGSIKNEIYMKNDLISYDKARIGSSTLVSIQTAAIRNLLRHDYPGPKPEVINADIKPLMETTTKLIDEL